MAEGTLLVANIRGFARFNQEQGNEAAANLDRKFADLVQKEIKAGGGQLADQRSGEIAGLFDSSLEGLRAATKILEDFEQAKDTSAETRLGLGVGLAQGSYAKAGTAYVGITLKLAEGLCALAAPGEILATEQFNHSVAGFESGALVERGWVQINGFLDPIQVFQVSNEAGESDGV